MAAVTARSGECPPRLLNHLSSTDQKAYPLNYEPCPIIYGYPLPQAWSSPACPHAPSPYIHARLPRHACMWRCKPSNNMSTLICTKILDPALWLVPWFWKTYFEVCVSGDGSPETPVLGILCVEYEWATFVWDYFSCGGNISTVFRRKVFEMKSSLESTTGSSDRSTEERKHRQNICRCSFS